MLAIAAACLLLWACRSSQGNGAPSISFTDLPLSSPGGPNKLDRISGRVTGAKPGQQVVLYAKSGIWWVQPLTRQPFTTIERDSTWRASIHLGTEYAALLVDKDYTPAATLKTLPEKGPGVIAVVSRVGKGFVPAPPAKRLHFSGYDWEVRQMPSTRGGKANPYDPANAWTDKSGFMHLRVTHRANEWACAEVRLTRSLGQGLFLFTVQDVSRLDPAAVMSLYTWDDEASEQHHREVDIEVSRFGDPAGKNAQYVIQPYYEPENVVRFEAPAGPLIFSFRREPGKVSFRTARGTGRDARAIAEHVFTSGVPSPGGESVLMNLYNFGNSRIPMRDGAEVVIEKFQFLP